jgi:hypothetical protein
MATNPNLRPPDRRSQPELVHLEERRARFPWPLIALIVAGVILACIIYALPRTPKAAPGPAAGQVPDQPFGNELQMTGLRVAPAPVGSQVYVYGEIENTGSTPVGQVTVDATFSDAQGHLLQRETRNLELLKSANGAPEVVTTPLKSGATTPFRVGFDSIPSSWDHQVPRMQIVHVSAPGQGGIPAGEAGGQLANPPANGGATSNTPGAAKNQTSTSATGQQSGGTVTPEGTTPNGGANSAKPAGSAAGQNGSKPPQ